MEPLAPEEASRLLPLLERCPMRGHRALLYAVVEGRQPGALLVDNRENPRAALICNYSGFYFALGEPHEEEIGAFLPELLFRYLTAEPTSLFATTEAWRDALRPLFSEEVSRIAFDFQRDVYEAAARAGRLLPPGFRLEPLDARWAAAIASDARGRDGLDPWFIRIAGGPEGYASAGLGVCAVQEERVESFCGYCGIGGGEVELEVGTARAFEGMGLATAACLAFLADCLAKQLRPAYS